MNSLRIMGAALATTAMLATAVPADARDWGRGRWHHRGDRIDGGDVLLGAVIAGGLIAAISAASRADRERRNIPRDTIDPPLPPPADWDRSSRDPRADDDFADLAGDATGNEDTAPPATYTEDAAVDSCAVAAEDEGRRLAPLARVQDITDVDARRDGSWYVQGTIELRDGYRDADRQEQRFRCTIVTGEYPRVVIEGFDVAAR